MVSIRITISLITLSVVGILLVLWTIGHARKSMAQIPEKTLTIERYPN